MAAAPPKFRLFFFPFFLFSHQCLCRGRRAEAEESRRSKQGAPPYARHRLSAVI